MAQDIVIGGRLHSAATGNTVAGANEILDDAKGKKQNVINQEVDNEIGSDSAAGTIKGRIKNLETAVGSGGSVDERIAETKAEIIGDAAADYNTLGKVEDKIQETKSEILGDAASDYNTLGKVEDKIQAETSRAEAAEGALDNAKANKATTLEGYGIIDAYTKNETYTKTEVNGLVDTPHQNYVTVLTYAALIAIDPGSTDTIYRVSNYDGSVPQVDVTKYSEYAWDGTQYVFLCVKSQIDEVFDISVYNNNATYADLAAALGTDGANVPQTLRRGGMSVKFVHSVDNKYVQYRLKTQSFSADENDWYNCDIDVKQNSELDGYNIKVGNKKLNGILAGYQLGKYYDGTPIDNVILDNDTIDNVNIFVSSQNFGNGIKHINKIRFVAKEGTIYFYKIYAPQISQGLSISRELIASVVNIQSEVDTIKEVAVDIDLLENEFIGINGSIAYTTISGKGYQGFNVTVSSNTIAQTSNNLALGYMAISDVSGLSDIIENRQNQMLSRYGTVEVNNYTTDNDNIFVSIDLSKKKPRFVRAIELLLNANQDTKLYKVSVTNSVANATLLGSVKGDGVTKVPLNISLAENEYIGIGGFVAYENNTRPVNFKYFYFEKTGGTITESNNGSALGYALLCAMSYDAKSDNTIIVSPFGDGDYTNLHEALKGTFGKDTPTHPIHIKVMPGIYNEPTLTFDEEGLYCNNRYLSIVGVDKQNCIIRNDKGYYNGSSSGVDNYGDNAPIKVNGNIYIANLTIISTDDDATSSDNVYHRSYCIHTDAGASQNTTLEIHNCILKNNHAPCIGYGIPKGNTLKITNCELYTELYNVSDWNKDGAVIWGHDRRAEPSAEIDEFLFIKDCVIKSSNTNAIVSVNNESGLMSCTFINNAVSIPSGMGIDLDVNTAIDKLSYGNALIAMNYLS